MNKEYKVIMSLNSYCFDCEKTIDADDPEHKNHNKLPKYQPPNRIARFTRFVKGLVHA